MGVDGVDGCSIEACCREVKTHFLDYTMLEDVVRELRMFTYKHQPEVCLR